MTPFEISRALDSMMILVDTREQDTEAFRQRIEAMGRPVERRKLDFGDYSVACHLPDGTDLDLSGRAAVERKMSMDELCSCYVNRKESRGRDRFVREFERAAATGAKLYLLIENGSWEKAYNGVYRSQMNPKSLVASMLAWLARYNCQILFCKPETSGKLIGDILYRELKEHLENGTYGSIVDQNAV